MEDTITALIPVLGILFTMGPLAALLFSYTPLGRAIVERLRGRSSASDDRLLDEIERLQEQLAQQESRFEELHDRLDFAERLLLAQGTRPDEAAEEVTPV